LESRDRTLYGWRSIRRPIAEKFSDEDIDAVASDFDSVTRGDDRRAVGVVVSFG
jgi:hypothetical protein